MGAVLKTICGFIAACAVFGIFLEALGSVLDFLHAAGVSLPTHFGPLKIDFDLAYMPGVPFAWQAAATLLDDIDNFLMIATLVFLIRLLLLYAKGEVFSARALKYLNAIAVCYLGCVLAGFVELGPATFVQSWPLGRGHREITISFPADDLAGLFKAAVIFVVARVMEQARSLADENARFV